MTCDLNNVIGKTVERIDEHSALVFTDGTVLQFDHDGCPGIYTQEEWKQEWA